MGLLKRVIEFSVSCKYQHWHSCRASTVSERVIEHKIDEEEQI